MSLSFPFLLFASFRSLSNTTAHKTKTFQAREREERGEIRQCNDGKWKFSFSEDSPGFVVLDVHVQKHLSSSLVDVDCHPLYISIVIKSKVLRLVLPCEVEAEGAKAQRSATTGHLVVTMKKLNANENMIALRAARKHAEAKVEEERKKRLEERARREGGKLGNQLLSAQAGVGAVKLDGIAKKSSGGVGRAKEEGFGMTEVATKALKEPAREEGGESGEGGEKTKIAIEMDDGDDSDDEEGGGGGGGEEEDSDGDEPPPIF